MWGIQPDATVPVPERHPDHVLVVDGAHLVGHHVAELGKLNLPRPVSVVLNKVICSINSVTGLTQDEVGIE